MRHDLESSCVSIRREGEGLIVADFVFDGSLRVFEGHFPGNPIVPGVLLIEAVRFALEASSGSRYAIERLSKARFKAIVRPGERVSVKVRRAGEGSVGEAEAIPVKATVERDGATVATLAMTMTHKS